MLKIIAVFEIFNDKYCERCCELEAEAEATLEYYTNKYPQPDQPSIIDTELNLPNIRFESALTHINSWKN